MFFRRVAVGILLKYIAKFFQSYGVFFFLMDPIDKAVDPVAYPFGIQNQGIELF